LDDGKSKIEANELLERESERNRARAEEEEERDELPISKS